MTKSNPSKKKKTIPLIDSRHLKIIAAKKADLKDSLVIICLDETHYGSLEKTTLRKIAEQLQSIEPDAVYFPVTKSMNVQIFDKSEFKGKKLLITVKHDKNISNEQVDDQIKKAIPEAKAITVIHADVDVGEDS